MTPSKSIGDQKSGDTLPDLSSLCAHRCAIPNQCNSLAHPRGELYLRLYLGKDKWGYYVLGLALWVVDLSWHPGHFIRYGRTIKTSLLQCLSASRPLCIWDDKIPSRAKKRYHERDHKPPKANRIKIKVFLIPGIPWKEVGCIYFLILKK